MFVSFKARNIPIITVEESALQGGFGSAVLEFFNDQNLQAKVKRIGIPDVFIEHGDVESIIGRNSYYDRRHVNASKYLLKESSRYISS